MGLLAGVALNHYLWLALPAIHWMWWNCFGFVTTVVVALLSSRWFADAPVKSILNVKLPHHRHLYWPDLDVDLSIESVEHPERFPLVSKSAMKPQ